MPLATNAIVDADCAERQTTAVSGVAVMMGKTVVSARTTPQHCVSFSTNEAEYVAMTHGAKVAVFQCQYCCLFSRTCLEILLKCTRALAERGTSM